MGSVNSLSIPKKNPLSDLLGAWNRYTLVRVAVLHDTHLMFYMPLADRLVPLTGLARGRQHLRVLNNALITPPSPTKYVPFNCVLTLTHEYAYFHAYVYARFHVFF